MMLHGLGDCTPERNCGCMARPLEVLRKRIARALWESDGQLPEWDAVPPGGQFRRAYYLSQADAVIAALELEEGLVSFDGERQRCWTTPWERIEEDA